MGARTQTKVARKTTKAVQVRVAAVVDGFLEVMPAEAPAKKRVQEKVVRKLRALHPMD